ncbi:hypothetical protein ABHN84_17420 [Shewanella vesiculosa]|jgi:hypothetical protein|uniref:DUF4124 domain-containing protein n=1 Tax=Shewanella vesiculosa TaxID=518738 RepID=A0ABV0FVL7_9GAMM
MFDKYIVSLSFTLLLISLPINAEIFKCENEVKQVYQDMPCDAGASQSTVDVVIQNDNSKKYKPYNVVAYDPTEFSDAENLLIKHHKVEVGMRVKALEFSWGRVQKINRSAYGPEQ